MNVSEGRNRETLAALRNAAGGVLRDFHADGSHNRAVATLLGRPEAVVATALAVARAAVDCIDLRSHAGEHPRVGAVDVVPFTPVRGVNLEDCVGFAREFGERFSAETGVPVYLYEQASAKRRTLPSIRRGGLAGLAARMAADPPDFGPARPHPTAGVTCVGARAPLLAYNVWLKTNDVAVARRIAGRLRERGGGLPGVRALGLLVGGRAQVSVNITDTDAVSLWTVWEAVRRLARYEGVAVEGSELVGGITAAQALKALNGAIGANIAPGQVLDAEAGNQG
jgi:glutamate formiminotransferase